MLFVAVESIAASQLENWPSIWSSQMSNMQQQHVIAYSIYWLLLTLAYLMSHGNNGSIYLMSMAILSGTHQKPKAGFIVCNSAIKMYTDTSFAKDMITCKSVSWYMSVKNKAVIMYKKAF